MSFFSFLKLTYYFQTAKRWSSFFFSASRAFSYKGTKRHDTIDTIYTMLRTKWHYCRNAINKTLRFQHLIDKQASEIMRRRWAPRKKQLIHTSPVLIFVRVKSKSTYFTAVILYWNASRSHTWKISGTDSTNSIAHSGQHKKMQFHMVPAAFRSLCPPRLVHHIIHLWPIMTLGTSICFDHNVCAEEWPGWVQLTTIRCANNICTRYEAIRTFFL